MAVLGYVHMSGPLIGKCPQPHTVALKIAALFAVVFRHGLALFQLS